MTTKKTSSSVLRCELCKDFPRVGVNTLSSCGIMVTGPSMGGVVDKWNRIQLGLMALANKPDPRKVLRERLLRLIKTRGEVSEGVLLNLVRPTSWGDMTHEMVELMKSGEVKATLRENPRNKKSHTIYSTRH